MVHMDSISEELNSQGDVVVVDNFVAASEATAPRTHESTNHNIILYPFAHQVGGHTQLLTLDKGTLCKPLIPRELLFYLNVPTELVNFVPAYKGVVQIRETGPGNFPPLVYQPLRSPKSPYANGKGTNKFNNTTTNTNSTSNCYTKQHHHHHNHHHHHHHQQQQHHCHEHDTSHKHVDSSQSVTDLFGCSSPLELKVQIRPCSDEKILKKNLSQDNLLRADYISRPNEKYLLLLENVASKYQLPCILDLKMGTRQHGDDATEEKRHRQIAKCQASTSASLGVRLCGMQVYQVDYGGFLWYDKYYGRKMNEDGLKRALHEYFRNGSQLNEDIIDDVIVRLKLLSKAVEKSPSFRFYGTSLLIIHEGCTSRSNTKRCPVDVRLIDFAHTICDYTNTNGRSSSSPSVLKSSSAEQLTVKQTVPISSSNHDEAHRLTGELSDEHDDWENLCPPQPQQQQQEQRPISPLPSPSLSPEPAPPPSTTSMVTAKQQQQQQSTQPQPKQSLATPPAPPSSPRSEEVDDSHHHHLHRVKEAELVAEEEEEEDHGVVVSDHDEESESDIENNNNNNNDSNLSGSSIANALRTAIRKQDSSVESLCEIDITSTSADSNNIIMKPSSISSSSGTTTTTTKNNNNDENTIIKQINSTPTTPPSIGSRKISKTSIGPDKGLLFGLENLMRLLVDLKSETLITC